MDDNIQDTDNQTKVKPIALTIKIAPEAFEKIKMLAIKYRRSVTKEIEWLIMEAE